MSVREWRPGLRRLLAAWRWVSLDRPCRGCGWPLVLAPSPACPTCCHAPVDYPRDADELRRMAGQ